MQAVATNERRDLETPRKEGMGYRRDYIGTPGTIEAGPQAFLVERPYAGARINPHFHDVDQFQIIIRGDGRIGSPICTDLADNGLSFVVIEKNAELIAQAEEMDYCIIRGDATSDTTLKQAGIESAAGVVAALSADKDECGLDALRSAREDADDPVALLPSVVL